MAKSKNAKKRAKAKQAQHRQQHNVQKQHDRASHQDHLPKTGTAEDDEYLLRRSREDVVDFGVTRVKGGWVNWVIGAIVFAAIVGLIILVAIR